MTHETQWNVGRAPWSAADAPVGLLAIVTGLVLFSEKPARGPAADRRVRPTVLALLFAVSGFGTTPALMPAPVKATFSDGGLVIDSNFRVAATGYSDARLQTAIGRLAARVSRQTGIPLIAGGARPTLTIACHARGTEMPSLGEDESYRLDVAADGARIESNTVMGALRGMETFAQLIVSGTATAAQIEDHPRFPWRGLMLDVSRHWMPVEVVKRNLDAMAAVKLNVFHWHLSDDQGFRVESQRYPRLQQFGSDGHFYTQPEIREVISYAAARGIRVVPEFDMPGHTTSWFVGYPNLASAPGPYAIERKWGIFEPTMNPAREETFQFLDGFVEEMAALFPDPYFHIGGDEVEDAQWKRNPGIQEFARQHHLENSRELHAYFNHRLQELLHKYGKTMVGWDEVFEPALAAETVIQSWRGQAALADAARKGYRGILSFGYYLDHMNPAAFHYAVDPVAEGLGAAESGRILGGEACMWNEYASAETVDSRIWPRMTAIAERLWSPREITDVNSMYARMEAVSANLDWTGVQHHGNYAPMLERLAGGHWAEPLRVLADASEATGIEIRRDARQYTSLVPLNRFVDAVRPESASVRHLEQDVQTCDAAALAELRVAFREWAENDQRLNGLVEELKPLSRNLSLLGAMGLHALEFLESGRPAAAAWISEQERALAGMEKPSAEVVLAATRPVRLLLEAVGRTGGKPPAPGRE